MSQWPGGVVGQVLGVNQGEQRSFDAISTDSRQVRPNSLFVALSGERFDGHEFLGAARAGGATGAVVRRGTPPLDGMAWFEVEDPLVALGWLARHRRRSIAGPVVAITGTNGKTSTRAMLTRVLGSRWVVHATRENLNNLIGVPLTILSAPAEAEALVVECGANLPGEIARLRSIVEPTIGIVTNVAPGHLAGFGSIDGVLEEKVQLVNGVELAVVGLEPSTLASRARKVARRVVTAGLSAPADIAPDQWALDGEARATIQFRGRTVRLPIVGTHQASNAMLALAVAVELRLDLDRVAGRLSDLDVPHGRCEVLRQGNLTLLYDAYNANPASLGAALTTASAMRQGRRLVLALGSMLELGPESEAWHRRMAEAAVAIEPDLVAVVGQFEPAFAAYRDRLGDRLITAPDADALGRAVAARLKGDELVLLKASRGVRMERALPHLIPGHEAPCSTTS